MSFFQFILDLFVEKDVRFFNNGKKFMEKGDYLKATYEFKEALNIKPTEENYHDAFGQSMYKRGMIPEADLAFAIADDLKQAATDPRDVKVLCRLARSFQDKRMFTVSQGYIQRTLSLDPNNDQAHCLLGRANFLGNKVSEAIMEYEKAIDLNAYCIEAYKGLEDIFRAQKKKAKEKEYGELAKHIAKTSKSAKDPVSHAELGDVFRKYKRLKEAEVEYKEAFKLDSQCPGALVGMGILSYEAGKMPDAREKFMAAIKINKYNSMAHSYLGLIYQSDPKTKKNAEWELELAKQLSAVEKATDPVKIYQAYINLGDFLNSHNRVDDAEEAYLRGIRANANVPEAYVKIALLYAKTNKSQQALDYCDHAIKLAPKQEIGFIGKGQVLMAVNDFEKAISHFQEALKFSPNNADIHDHLANAYEKKGMTKLAEKERKIVDSIKSTQEGRI